MNVFSSKPVFFYALVRLTALSNQTEREKIDKKVKKEEKNVHKEVHNSKKAVTTDHSKYFTCISVYWKSRSV